jgi:chromosome segregation ATPase
MTKDEARAAVMGAISMTLKDTVLQQGFEIICKENAELKETCNKWFEHLKNREEELLNELNNQNAKYESQIEELEKENTLVKSLLYCTKRTCDNCGFVNCENFQRQRKSEPCLLYIPYQVRIKNLAHESDVLRESYNNSEMNLSSVSEQLIKAKELLLELYDCIPSSMADSCKETLQKVALFFKDSEASE